ncbi:unnamed protein product [Periconia digitata]|uniref:Uncharacterized protein n=1 Tax=Periconia digitata TaxID=1303443 RepID=A0A9W4XM24_9PLEO|nr:unnamed protein product [Periconia digitata]
MVRYTFPAGAFFTYSPEIRIRQNPAVEDTIREVAIWIEQNAERGGRMNCQLFPSSDVERDGHLARLIGVKKMHAMLLKIKDKTGYWLVYHKSKRLWCASDDEPPCGMLAYNDKLWMQSWDNCYLKRYGQRRRDAQSCVPLQMKKGQWYRFSVQHCTYCNGTYDDTIQLALG